MVMPMFRPMPHWMPGIIASTSTPYMVMRSSTLPIIIRTLMLYSEESRHRYTKNRAMMVRGTPKRAVRGFQKKTTRPSSSTATPASSSALAMEASSIFQPPCCSEEV